MPPTTLATLLWIGLAWCMPVAALVTSPLQVRALPHEGRLPFVEAEAEPARRVANRINQAIYLELLEAAAPIRVGDGLNIRRYGGRPPPVTDVSFVVNRNDGRVLALTVSAEGCGAYCERFTKDYVFDALNGRRVQANDIFTATGATAVAALLTRQRMATLKAAESRLRARADPASKTGKPLTDDERQDSLDAADLYASCQNRFSHQAQPRQPLVWDELSVMADAVTFRTGRCSTHATQALDELGEFVTPLSHKDALPHLNAYGKHLLANGPVAPPPTSPFGQVLFGKVGQLPVTIWLRTPSGQEQSVGGWYFYDRFRQPIALFGQRQEDAWELLEGADPGKDSPRLLLTVNGDSLTGEWRGGNRRLPVAVSP